MDKKPSENSKDIQSVVQHTFMWMSERSVCLSFGPQEIGELCLAL